MAGYPKVKGYLIEHGVKQKYVASILDISITTFNNKINGVGDFTIGQVKKMCQELRMNTSIFFADYVPIKERKLNEIERGK